MNFTYPLTLILTIVFALFNAKGLALSGDAGDKLESNPPASLSPLLLQGLREAALRVDNKKRDIKVHEMLFKCRYPGQPEASESELNRGSPALLHGACNPSLYKDDVPRRRHIHRHGKHVGTASEGHQAQGSRGGVAVPLASEGRSEYTDSEHGSALHRTLTSARFTYSNPLSRHANLSSTASEDGFDLASIYGAMEYRAVFTPDDTEPRLIPTPTSRYFFDSEHFKAFLARWQWSSANAEFHVSQAGLDELHELAKSRVAYQHLSKHNRRQVAKLIFVRNGLETFGLIKAARSALGFTFDRHKTVENFLQAVHAYLMAVDGSESRLKVSGSVSRWILSADIFSLSYARCSKRKEYVRYRNSEGHVRMELGHYIFDQSDAYITGMIVLFQAWEESSSTAIDPAVLKNVVDRLEEFTKAFTGSYKDGCQLPGQ
ncbi:hypothetical protein PAPHI01_1928 [Pancytospora philotis]|nr:hypothetical protein PAPHI01_1928 [Pancytospora philotis]